MCNSPIGYPKCKRSFPWLIYIRKNSKEVAEWVKYHKIEHPRFGHKVTSACLVVKLHSKNNIRAQGIFHHTEMYWVTNSDGSLHTHLDVSWVSCYHALTMTESLNKGIFPEWPGCL